MELSSRSSIFVIRRKLQSGAAIRVTTDKTASLAFSSFQSDEETYFSKCSELHRPTDHAPVLIDLGQRLKHSLGDEFARNDGFFAGVLAREFVEQSGSRA